MKSVGEAIFVSYACLYRKQTFFLLDLVSGSIKLSRAHMPTGNTPWEKTRTSVKQRQIRGRRTSRRTTDQEDN
jgi:hypothetical protein